MEVVAKKRDIRIEVREQTGLDSTGYFGSKVSTKLYRVAFCGVVLVRTK